MAKRTLADIEADKEEINQQQAKLSEKWQKLDDEWFDVRHSDWDKGLIKESEALHLNLRSYSTEEQLKEAVDKAYENQN